MANQEEGRETEAALPEPPCGLVRSFLKNQFGLANSKPHTIMTEIWGGIVMYLVSLYILSAAVGWQAGSCPTCLVDSNATSAAGYTALEYQTLPGAISLAAGISTLVMGLFGNMPIVVAPGISGLALQSVSNAIGPDGAKAAALIVGLLVLVFSLASRRIKYISSIPEDYRLGMAAGKGGIIALVALRNSGLVSASTVGFNPTFNYNVILSICGFVIIALAQARKLITFSFVGEIVIITTASLIIRGATETTIVTSEQAAIIDMSIIAGAPSFAGFVYENGFIIFSYVISATLNTLIDIVATVTAIILTGVVRTTIGYDKTTFTAVLSESIKCYNIFLCIAICEVLVSPFLGVAPVTPFIQSTAGVMVGARTGLSAVVCGCLFLISTLFAAPIASVIPVSATGPVVFVSCLPVVHALKYVDISRPNRAIPAYLAFFLMSFTDSIGVGFSFSYVVLFAVYTLSSDWIFLSPQMVCTFLCGTILLLIETGLVQTMEVLGILVGSVALAAILITLIMVYPLKDYFVKSNTMNMNNPPDLPPKNFKHCSVSRLRKTFSDLTNKHHRPLVPVNSGDTQGRQQQDASSRIVESIDVV